MKNLCFIISQNRKFLFFLCMTFFATNTSAQVHIGSESPPHASAMLEISSTNMGVLLPSVALTAGNDTSLIVNKKAVDGLIVFNTTENPAKNLYKGVYVWNSVKHLWENIVAKQNFHSLLISHFAIEETYLVAQKDSTNQSLLSSDPFETLTFNFKIDVNKDNCFDKSNSTFIVPKDGYYKIACGAEIDMAENMRSARDVAAIELVLTPLNSPNDIVIISSTVTRTFNPKTSQRMPLTPSVIYNGYLKKGEKITAKVNLDLSKKNFRGQISRKYLYINTF